MAQKAKTDDFELPSGILIGGKWLSDCSGGVMTHINPANGRKQKEFALAGPAEFDQAVRAAQAALPGWRAVPATKRRDLLFALASQFELNAEKLGRVGTMENGSVIGLTTAGAGAAAEWFRYYAGWIDKVHGDVSSTQGGLAYTLTEPFGVVAIILTWNGPTAAMGMQVAAALAAGCCVVLKPPELAPFTSAIFGHMCEAAGIPAGVVNILPSGPEGGDALVRHPGIDKINFTGGPETARRIQAACAQSLTPLVLELGGKSANILFDDADLDSSCNASAMGIAMLSGQVCVAPSRLLVHAPIYDAVVERVVAELKALPIGDPLNPSTAIGPVISDVACLRILGVIENARSTAEGELLSGGRRLPRDGFYLEPTVFGNVSNSSSLARNEVFGPVLSIIRFADEADAVAIANDSNYGLAAYLHTRDLSRAHRIASALDAGIISINGGSPGAPYMQFGGFKDSGYGKEGGKAGIMEYVRTKQVSIGLN